MKKMIRFIKEQYDFRNLMPEFDYLPWLAISLLLIGLFALLYEIFR